jgi:hypothetical protein
LQVKPTDHAVVLDHSSALFQVNNMLENPSIADFEQGSASVNSSVITHDDISHAAHFDVAALDVGALSHQMFI